MECWVRVRKEWGKKANMDLEGGERMSVWETVGGPCWVIVVRVMEGLHLPSSLLLMGKGEVLQKNTLMGEVGMVAHAGKGWESEAC